MSDSASKSNKNGAAGRQKKSSFQITSVTATRMSNDAGDDSADDLDESHTDDISRVTEGENETPSFSEDTFSKDDVFFNAGSTSLCSAPVIPTSSQYGLAIVPTHDAPAPGPDALDVINIGNVKTEASEPHVTTRNERFKVVKIESTEPFKRGRWQCMDYLDHSVYDEDSHEQSIPISTPKPQPQPALLPNQVSNMMPTVSNPGQIPQMAPSQQPPTAHTSPAPNLVNSQPMINHVVNSQPLSNQLPNMTSSQQTLSNIQMVPAQQHIVPQVQNMAQNHVSMVPTQSIVPQSQPIPTSQPQQLPMAPQSQTQLPIGTQSQPQQLPMGSQSQPVSSQTQLPLATSHQQLGTQGQQQQPMATQQPQQLPITQPSQMQQPMGGQSQQLSMSSQSQPQQMPMAQQGQPMATQNQQQLPMGTQSQQQQPMATQGQLQSTLGSIGTTGQQMQGQIQQPLANQNQPQQIPLTTQGQQLQTQMQQPIGTQNQPQQLPMGSQSQPQSLTAIPQALQQAGQQQMQQQLMQQQLQQQMQYYPQPMHQGGGMMGMMQQYPVQMPAGYGQPSYVPTMQQILPQQMMQPNFQNFQQHPPQATSSSSFPNPVPASGGMSGYNQNSQPVMSYPNPPQHTAMSYPQVMIPQQMVPQQPQPPQQQQPQVSHVTSESELQVGVALLESLVEANIVNADQTPASEDPESLFPSRLAHALAAYKERLSAATRPPLPAPSRAPSPSPSASGTSAVAIDNKIEQAMDLVKSHLMFAVREEVEVLREKISELMDRINLLELENSVLKAQASPETLATLAVQVTAGVKTNTTPSTN